MKHLDLSFISSARAIEVEAVEGGRPQNEFTFDPGTVDNDEEVPVLGRSVDDAEETEERVGLIRQFLGYARNAYAQRGLIYPFQTSAGGDSLEIVPGYENVARRCADLSGMIRKGQHVAKQFEETAFRALQKLIGGWGVCVGAPRQSGHGPKQAIEGFRRSLMNWEAGGSWPDDFAKNGDHGADGFIILGRAWGGPVVFFQAKNTNFDLKGHPEEFARIPEILNDWFGRRWNHYRVIIPVFAVNSVLTLEKKEEIYEARGTGAGVHILDAVDILCAEITPLQHQCRVHDCIIN
jgi:hypothetical protein